MKKAVIIGAGPAGLTAASELLDKTDIMPVVLEASDTVGGISRTVQYNGNRMDIGGHRFFSKNQEIMDWWTRMMPLQGSRSKDDILLGLDDKPLAPGGPDPEIEDRVILLRHRVSRIFFLRKFFDYPISLSKNTFVNMGLGRTVKAGAGYLAALIHKRPETSLENFYINRFGKPLYSMFFEDYTEKVWGVHPSQLGADWGSQRVKGISIAAVIKDMFNKALGRKAAQGDKVETSLIEQFIYPKYGPGQLWETVAGDVEAKGGTIRKEAEAVAINVTGGRVTSVDWRAADGTLTREECDELLSSMPVKDLVAALRGIDIPEDVARIARDLPYRDFITVGVCVRKLKIKNQTPVKTFDGRVPDTWIYVQERDVKVGRLQIFNNWSPYMVKDYEHTMWIGMEYFCCEGDELWQMSDADFIQMAVGELESIGIADPEDVLDSCCVKVKKAYPAYFGSYYELDKVRTFLDGIDNLWCLGRNGQHRYNNMDHSMLSAMECVRNLKSGIRDKDNVWNVNTEKEYHEAK
ncbi:MAG: NAD(P)/FAD-dependent oxidoreductase [Bacteroidales bacterium]|nr:NAD(P)/FAD-dependent oxidoreductase [Bacteroidales bacterium]